MKTLLIYLSFIALFLSSCRNNNSPSDSPNQNNWQRVSNGLPTNHEVLSLCVSNSVLMAGVSDSCNFYFSSDGGAIWHPSANRSQFNLEIWQMFSDSITVFAAASNVGILASSDNGLNWYARNSGMDSLNGGIFPFFTTVTKFNSLFIAGSVNSSNFEHLNYKSVDNGNTWTPTSPSMKTGLYCLTPSSNAVYAITLNDIVKYDPASDTWNIFSPVSSFYGYPKSLATFHDTLYLLTSNSYLFRYSEANNEWKELLISSDTPSFSMIKADNGIFVAGNNGIYFSNDGGNSFKRIGDQLSNFSIYDVVLFNNTVFAATSSGIWRHQMVY
jgi:hypothetical protein